MKPRFIHVVSCIAVFMVSVNGCALLEAGKKDVLTTAVVRTAITSTAITDTGVREEVEKIENTNIPGPAGSIPVRIYTPQAPAPQPVLVYFHGGGWVAGGLDIVDNICRYFAKRAGCLVVSVDYRLAPEHTFPAAVEDAYAAVQWSAQNARRLNADGARIAVGGDSAGGNLAAVVCLVAHDRQGPNIVFQLLAYPPTDLSSYDTPSYNTFTNQSGLTKVHAKWFRQQYLNSKNERYHPYASPVLAETLGGLPPALIITGQFDVLRDDGRAYTRRLRRAGVPVQYLETAQKGHATNYWSAASREIQDILDEAVQALKNAFSRQQQTLGAPASEVIQR